MSYNLVISKIIAYKERADEAPRVEYFLASDGNAIIEHTKVRNLFLTPNYISIYRYIDISLDLPQHFVLSILQYPECIVFGRQRYCIYSSGWNDFPLL